MTCRCVWLSVCLCQPQALVHYIGPVNVIVSSAPTILPGRSGVWVWMNIYLSVLYIWTEPFMITAGFIELTLYTPAWLKITEVCLVPVMFSIELIRSRRNIYQISTSQMLHGGLLCNTLVCVIHLRARLRVQRKRVAQATSSSPPTLPGRGWSWGEGFSCNLLLQSSVIAIRQIMKI